MCFQKVEGTKITPKTNHDDTASLQCSLRFLWLLHSIQRYDIPSVSIPQLTSPAEPQCGLRAIQAQVGEGGVDRTPLPHLPDSQISLVKIEPEEPSRPNNCTSNLCEVPLFPCGLARGHSLQPSLALPFERLRLQLPTSQFLTGLAQKRSPNVQFPKKCLKSRNSGSECRCHPLPPLVQRPCQAA